MKKKKASAKGKADLTNNTPSLFDRENLEFLDALRYSGASAVAMPGEAPKTDLNADSPDADRVFKRYEVDENDEGWGMGELNIKIIHRGRIRISRSEWLQVISTCSDGLVEDGIRKDFHLNILSHASGVRLVYVSYRYKQSGDKQRETRRGILFDEATNIRELMMQLAYWFMAQPHAEKNDAIWKKLVDEAMKKLRGSLETAT